jgi:hypothetical protein
MMTFVVIIFIFGKVDSRCFQKWYISISDVSNYKSSLNHSNKAMTHFADVSIICDACSIPSIHLYTILRVQPNRYVYDSTDMLPRQFPKFEIGNRDFVLKAVIIPFNITKKTQIIGAYDRSCFGTSQFRLEQTKDNTIGFIMADRDAQTWPGFVSRTCAPVHEETEICITRNGPKHVMFINGKEEVTKTCYSVIYAMKAIAQTPNFRVGARYAPGGQDFELSYDGIIKEFQIYEPSGRMIFCADPLWRK